MYDEQVVATEHGPVRGRTQDGVQVFRGIRYGRDTALTRFLPPLPPEPWTDVANAFAFGPSCPQDEPDTAVDRAQNPFLRKIGLTDNLPESEDCLFLNVWTPRVLDGAGRPVLVWVHSGGYAANSGSSPAIDGTRLAREDDVVVVTFNHRLNVLGYTHLTDDPASPYAEAGNVGQLDVVAVLRWVRDNIAAFGGDPSNVTVLGQSGGAMKISTLLAMPQAVGLFHRAVLQSGATVEVATPERAARSTARLRAELDLRSDDPAALAAVPVRDLMRAYHRASAGSMTAWGPVLDGRTVVGHPFSPEVLALSGDVPMILGDLDTEATLFLSGHADRLRRAGVDALVAALAGRLGAADARTVVDTVARAHPGADGYELAARIVSDAVFTGSTRLAAEARTAVPAPTWRYRITWRTPVDGGDLLSPHELDVALLFGNVETAAGLNGAGPEAYALSRALRAAWIAFARSGVPDAHGDPWPVYERQDRTVRVLTPTPELARDVDGAELAVLTPLLRREVDWLSVFG